MAAAADQVAAVVGSEPVLRARRAACRCKRPDPEFYMLRRDLWLQAVPDGAGYLCLSCLENRLGRPMVAADFVDQPVER